MLAINFNPFPNLITKRLILRKIDQADMAEILVLRSDPDTMKYIPRPLLKTNEEALEHIATIDTKLEANEGINWAITLKEDKKMIGIIGHYRIQPEHYRAEIGYILLPEFHGKGIISEAVIEVINYGFNSMGLNSIEAIIDPKNTASEKVLQKTGFLKEAHLLENEFFEGRFLDKVIYSILKRNWQK